MIAETFHTEGDRMRWYSYNGDRITSKGHRTFVEIAPTIRFGPTSKRYGYVWPQDGSFRAYYEVFHPGQVEDVELGSFSNASDARRAVEAALTQS
jgi:hypothetical protein